MGELDYAAEYPDPNDDESEEAIDLVALIRQKKAQIAKIQAELDAAMAALDEQKPPEEAA